MNEWKKELPTRPGWHIVVSPNIRGRRWGPPAELVLVQDDLYSVAITPSHFMAAWWYGRQTSLWLSLEGFAPSPELLRPNKLGLWTAVNKYGWRELLWPQSEAGYWCTLLREDISVGWTDGYKDWTYIGPMPEL